MKHAYARLLLATALGASIGAASAQSTAPAPATPALPEWDKLTPAQRETVLAPLREHWNDAAPDERARMFGHAQRWQQMSPQQREHAHDGMRRFEHLSPEQREAARALFFKMRGMPPEQRKQLIDQWKAMTPQQRQQWLQQNPPPADDDHDGHAPPGDRDMPPPPRP